MKLTVLGKYGPYPKAGGATGAYMIESKNARINLDFGSGAIARTLEATGELPKTIVLSHTHFDHTSDLLPLVYALKTPIEVYLPFDESPISELVQAIPLFKAVRITDGMHAKICGLDFEFTRLVHPVESYGMRVSDGEKRFFYSGDTTFNERIIPAARGCGLALLDAAQPSHVKGAPHMSLTDARKIADAIDARVLVTHVHPEFSPYDEAADLGLTVAEEGKEYLI